MGKVVVFIVGILCIVAGLHGLIRKKINISWTEAGDDIKQKKGISAILWSIYFLVIGLSCIWYVMQRN